MTNTYLGGRPDATVAVNDDDIEDMDQSEIDEYVEQEVRQLFEKHGNYYRRIVER